MSFRFSRVLHALKNTASLRDYEVESQEPCEPHLVAVDELNLPSCLALPAVLHRLRPLDPLKVERAQRLQMIRQLLTERILLILRNRL